MQKKINKIVNDVDQVVAISGRVMNKNLHFIYSLSGLDSVNLFQWIIVNGCRNTESVTVNVRVSYQYAKFYSYK